MTDDIDINVDYDSLDGLRVGLEYARGQADGYRMRAEIAEAEVKRLRAIIESGFQELEQLTRDLRTTVATLDEEIVTTSANLYASLALRLAGGSLLGTDWHCRCGRQYPPHLTTCPECGQGRDATE